MILILDFGSQTAHLIERRLKDLGVRAELVEPDEVLKKSQSGEVRGIILSGGPASVYETGAPTIDKKVFEMGIPILGICYGWQLMAKALGGRVDEGKKEYGVEVLEIVETHSINLDLAPTTKVVMSHGDSVVDLPVDFTVIGKTRAVEYAAVVNQGRKLYGLQFHPEADHTEGGTIWLKNFAQLCGETFEIKPTSIEELVSQIKTRVGKDRVICAVSGGVDSTVAAALMAKAIGQQLLVVYVESGLMRPGTKDKVKMIFDRDIPAELVVIEAEIRFRQSLMGITDPETKRKVIGRLYVDLFEAEAKNRQGIKFLGQGTIYSDVIESKGSHNAAKIKSHHNVGGLPETMKLNLLEPLSQLFKDEVRVLGRELGLPDEIVSEQPFPGPGYAIRIRGEVTEKRLSQAIQADLIVIEEIKRAGLWEQMFQCFAVMTGALSTAVKGDGRSFAEVVAIRAYESNDVMTSQWARIPFEVLDRMAKRIVNEVPDVSRVVYDITGKPPATMEWE